MCCQIKIVLTLKITANFLKAVASCSIFQFANFIAFNEEKGKKKKSKLVTAGTLSTEPLKVASYAYHLSLKTPCDTYIYCAGKRCFSKKVDHSQENPFIFFILKCRLVAKPQSIKYI